MVEIGKAVNVASDWIIFHSQNSRLRPLNLGQPLPPRHDGNFHFYFPIMNCVRILSNWIIKDTLFGAYKLTFFIFLLSIAEWFRRERGFSRAENFFLYFFPISRTFHRLGGGQVTSDKWDEARKTSHLNAMIGAERLEICFEIEPVIWIRSVVRRTECSIFIVVEREEKRRCELIPARFLLIDGYQRISRNKIEGFLIASDYSYSSTPCRLNGNCQLRSVSAVQRGTEVGGWHKLTGSAAVARNQFHIVELSFQSSINRAWRIIVSLHQLFFYAARLPTERKRFFLISSISLLAGDSRLFVSTS